MFWKKKAEPQSPAQSPRRGMSMDSPRPQPILKTAPDQGGGPSIRFAGAGPAGGHPRSQSHPASFTSPKPAPQQNQWVSTPPTADHASRPPLAVLTSPAANPAIQRLQGSRRSSRPTSPSSTSFGARLPQAPRSAPLSTPPMISPAHVTTPPTAYASSMNSRAPPPPSPYRPTSERRLTPETLASRPPRISSLFETPSAPGRLGVNLGERTPGRDEDLPTFNFIPATPQAMGEEWGVKRSVSGSALERAFDDMVDIPLETSSSAPTIGGMDTILEGIPTLDSLPAIANLEFSPFEMTVSLPSVESGSSISSLPYSLDSRSSLTHSAPLPAVPQLPPNEPLPSPPFESYPSLPSLDSEPSLRSSTSQSSLPSSSSNSSLASYSDVEEALGSMLASLSDPSMPLSNRTDRVGKSTSNPGLGLGLSIPPSASITAPLSPRRKGPPPPLDLANTTREAAGPDQQSAPARINHRVAFYTTARAAPNSPSSGIFINGDNGTEFIVASPTRSESGNSISSDDTQLPTAKDVNGWRDSIRSSISFGSEASDDDPYTASIVCLMPVKGGVAAVHRDEYLAEETEVGLAL